MMLSILFRVWWITFAAQVLACGDPLADGGTEVKLRIDHVSPSVIPSTGGIEVTVVGQNFSEGMTIFVNGTPALGIVRKSDSLLTFVAPAEVIGPKELKILGTDGKSAIYSERLRYFAQILEFSSGNFLANIPNTTRIFAGLSEGAASSFIVESADPAGGFKDSVLVADGDGGFRVTTEIPIADGIEDYLYSARQLVDVNGDGFADIIHTDFGLGGVAFGTANGFKPRQLFKNWAYSFFSNVATLVGDFDGNGQVELAAIDWYGDIFRINYSQDETASVALTPAPRSDESGPWSWLDAQWARTRGTVGDFNRDGRDDLALIGMDEQLHLLLGPEFAEAWHGTLPGVALNPFSITEQLSVQDFDGDRFDDLYIHNASKGFVVTWNIQGVPSVTHEVEFGQVGCSSLSLEDSTTRQWTAQPGHAPTLLVGCGDESHLWSWIDGTFQWVGVSPGRFLVDLNGDKYIDVLSNRITGVVAFPALAPGRFLSAPSFPVATAQSSRYPVFTEVSPDGQKSVLAADEWISWIGDEAGIPRVKQTIALPEGSGVHALYTCRVQPSLDEKVLAFLGTQHGQWNSFLILGWNGSQFEIERSVVTANDSRMPVFPDDGTACQFLGRDETSVTRWTVLADSVKDCPAYVLAGDLDTLNAEMNFHDLNQDGVLDIMIDKGRTAFLGTPDKCGFGPQTRLHHEPWQDTAYGFGGRFVSTPESPNRFVFWQRTQIGIADLGRDLAWTLETKSKRNVETYDSQLAVGDFDGDGGNDYMVFGGQSGVDTAMGLVISSSGGVAEVVLPWNGWGQALLWDADRDGLDDIWFVQRAGFVSWARNGSQ